MTLDHALEVRFVDGQGWHILLELPHKWHKCRSEQDARFIANGMRIAAAVTRGQHDGEETAQELDEAIATLDRTIGPSPSGKVMKESARSCRGLSDVTPALSEYA